MAHGMDRGARTRRLDLLGVNAGIEVCHRVLAVALDGRAVVCPAHTRTRQPPRARGHHRSISFTAHGCGMAMAWRAAQRSAAQFGSNYFTWRLPPRCRTGPSRRTCVTQTGGDSHEWGERCGDKERRADDDDTGEWGKTRWLGSRRASEEGGGKEEGRGRGAIDAILLAEELAHARLPPPALVERDASVIGAAPGEPCALPPEHVDELLFAQVAHLLAQEDDDY